MTYSAEWSGVGHGARVVDGECGVVQSAGSVSEPVSQLGVGGVDESELPRPGIEVDEGPGPGRSGIQRALGGVDGGRGVERPPSRGHLGERGRVGGEPRLGIRRAGQQRVDADDRVVWVEGGATLADLDAETSKYNLACPVGVVSRTGVAGLTTGGGYGWLRSKHGMSIDNLRAVDIGEILDAPEGTIRTRIRRAKQLLEVAIKEVAAPGGDLDFTIS